MNADVKLMEDPFEAMQAVSELRHRTNDVDIGDGFVVTLRSLGAKDETESFVECMNFWGQAFLYKHKIEVLARSIHAVNNQPFHGPDVSPEEKKKVIEEKKKIIGAWHQGVIDDLYVEYARLSGNIDEYLDKMAVVAETNAAGVQEALKQREVMNTDSPNLEEAQNEQEESA